MPSKIVTEERKAASRMKEKKRNVEINDAFEQLQSSFYSVPFVRRKQKVPKVKMLRLALKYIQHLNGVLHNDYHQPTPFTPPRPLRVEDFEMIAVEEFNERNDYTKRLDEDEAFRSGSSMNSSRECPSSTVSSDDVIFDDTTVDPSIVKKKKYQKKKKAPAKKTTVTQEPLEWSNHTMTDTVDSPLMTNQYPSTTVGLEYSNLPSLNDFSPVPCCSSFESSYQQPYPYQYNMVDHSDDCFNSSPPSSFSSMSLNYPYL